jgi:GNAT superfamily N-acetyltransferase
MCGATVEGEDIDRFGEAWMGHCADLHADLPYPPMAVRAFGDGLARMTGGAERLDAIGAVEVHRVTPDRVDDWLDLFDHDVMVGHAENASCYCLESHERGSGDEIPYGDWRARRAAMADRLRTGATVGYLAYVDGAPAGWVNASMRGDYSLHRRNDTGDDCTVGIACFAVAPPFRGHGLATKLLDRVVADAGSRGATAVEAYPFNEGVPSASHFRGPRPLYDHLGFTEVRVRQHDTVLRRAV